MTRKRLAVFGLCCLLAGGFFQLISYVFFINITDSLPLGLYLRVPMTGFQRGDYIVYEPGEEVRQMVRDYGWGDGSHTFMKRVGAVAGEHYVISETTCDFTVEGQLCGKVFETDTEGNSLPKLRGEFVVPDGHVLPVATNPRSFDGRYTGAIPICSIKAKVIPLWIP